MIKRRTLLGGAIAGTASLGCVTVPANAAPLTLRIGNDVSANDPVTTELVAAADRIKQRTDGAVVVTSFPNSQLGAGSEMLAPVRSGAVEGYFFSSGLLSSVAPDAGISGLGFAFHGYDDAWKALDGTMGDVIKASIRRTGLVPMDTVWEIGLRQIATNTVAVNAVGDLGGLKIRVPVSQIYVSMFRALGAAPVTMNYAEVYAGLQTKLVNGLEGPLSTLLTTKMYEVTNKLAITNHMWDGFWLTLSSRTWERLGQYQPIVAEEFTAGALRARKQVADGETRNLSDLQAKGMAVTRPDIQAFRKKLVETGYFDTWKAKFSPDAWAAFQALQSN